MPLPGWLLTIGTSPPNPGSGALYSVGFAVGQATIPGVGTIYSIDQFEDVFGARNPASPLYDGADVFFREGGKQLNVSATDMEGVDADLVTALGLFTEDMGIGSVAAFGHTTETIYQAVAAHAEKFGRLAFLDAPDTDVVATLTTSVGYVTGSEGDTMSGMFAPWDIAPGVTPGTTRNTPPSARVMGNLARNDALGLGTNDAAAGALGIAQYVQDVTQSWDAGDRTTLNGLGINVSKIVLGDVRTYGFRTCVDQTTNPLWSLLSNSRSIMAIQYQLGIVAENFVFSKLDGAGITIKKFAGQLMGALLPFYMNGDLWALPTIDTGPSVNTLTTIAANQLNAKVGLQFSEFAEQVPIMVTKEPIDQALPV